MARAHRHHLPGYVWHITHRCHKREFLLKFGRDRRAYRSWLFEAKKRYGLCILNYMVTSNHVHLLLVDDEAGTTIPRSIQLAAGRTGQQYNRRKQRKGAFWQDRYHATAVETGAHLIRCLVYIDMNMVRAGVVDHPSNWDCCGFHEIQHPKERYRLIDRERLSALLGIDSADRLADSHGKWIEAELKRKEKVRQERWTERIAVGGRAFVEDIRDRLGMHARSKWIDRLGDTWAVRETSTTYSSDFTSENGRLRTENQYFWN